MGYLRPKMLRALADFEPPPSCKEVCKGHKKPTVDTGDDEPRSLSPCEKCRLEEKRHALFRLAILRAANWLEKNNQMDLKGEIAGAEGSSKLRLEKRRIARATIELEFGHKAFHEIENLDVPMTTMPGWYDEDDDEITAAIGILNSNWPCI